MERLDELLAVPAQQVAGAGATSDSSTRLLQSLRSIRSTKSASALHAAAWRPAMIDSMAPKPTFLTAPSPKRIRLSPTTVNLKPDSLH